MRFVNFVLIIFLFIYKIQSLPTYIKPCTKSSPDFVNCLMVHGNDALPHLIKGDKSLQLPNMLPLRFPKVNVDAGPNLKLSFSDLDFYGLDTAKLSDMHFDINNKVAYHTIVLDKVTLLGNYQINGKLLVLPISGKGPANLTAEECLFHYKYTYLLKNKSGKNYLHIEKETIDWKIRKAHFKFENLFNGNKVMGDSVNKFLNENDQDVLKELGGAITGLVEALAEKIASSIYGNIPFDELFL